MNNISLSASTSKSFLSTLIVFSLSILLLTNCKKESEQSPAPDPVVADSSSISSLIVSCQSSDASATGFAVIDIQQFFLAKKLVSSTTKGKIFSVKTANESDFKAVVDKLILDLQVPESYFRNYDSFLSIVEEQFKTKAGYQKAYDINQAQAEQLFNKQGVALAFQENKFKSAFLRSMVFASAGLGTRRLAPLAETFTLNRFLGLMTVGTKISGPLASNTSIKNFFGAGANRSTSLTKDDQVIYKSFVSGSSGSSGYSYSYPLPPSPAPVFDAPVWYWHQYSTGNTGAIVAVLPPNTSTTSWATTQDRYQALRLKSQQVTGGTVAAAPPTYGTLDPNAVVTDAETAYMLYSANYIQDYKDPGVTVWHALDNNKHELYAIGLYSNGEIRIDKFINATYKNGLYYSTPTWALTWKK